MFKGTSVLREKNKRKILSFIRQLGQTSRQDLVKLMGVSKNTISLIVDELINEGILIEVGEKELGKKGRPKILIKINKESYKSVGLSVSKSNIDYSVISYCGQIIDKGSYLLESSKPERVKKNLLASIRNLLEQYDSIIGIGIGIPGILDSDRKFVHTSTHLDWKNVSLHELDEISIPVYVKNSVNMGAISALDSINDKGNGSLFFIKVSEGVGGAYLMNHVVLNGASWTAGEIGHISVDPDGERCRCGQRGCLEHLINYDAFYNDTVSFGSPLVIQNGKINTTTQTITDDIKKLMYLYGIYMGRALTLVIHLMNPNKIIIDAPYNIFQEFQDGCNHFLKEHVLTIPFKHTKIIFGNDQYSMSHGAALSTIIHYEKALE